MILVKQNQDPNKNALGYTTKDYFELVDWAGRAIRENKSGYIPKHIASILDRLILNADTYQNYVEQKT